jgi:predicted alpha/beta-hydrolase family hydrolase
VPLLPLLLYPGAGSSSEHRSLLAIEAAVAPRRCLRADFPYRLAGRRAPDRAPVLLDAVRSRVLEIGPVIAGGRSMGGRICSMVAAEGVSEIRALVLISYPLHPPGRPEKLRIEHLADISVPVLAISGTRDTFGTPDELTHHLATVPTPVTHVWIEGRGHDLKGADDVVAASVSRWLSQLDGV